jgi:hypothetical protein
LFGCFERAIESQSFPADAATLQLVGAFSVIAEVYLMRPIGGLLLMTGLGAVHCCS